MDEDCESTNSVVRYGMKLCEQDLREHLHERMKRENRTENGYSDTDGSDWN